MWNPFVAKRLRSGNRYFHKARLKGHASTTQASSHAVDAVLQAQSFQRVYVHERSPGHRCMASQPAKTVRSVESVVLVVNFAGRALFRHRHTQLVHSVRGRGSHLASLNQLPEKFIKSSILKNPDTESIWNHEPNEHMAVFLCLEDRLVN